MAQDSKENKERRSYEVFVSGRVQGVGFRWWTKRQADGLGLDGSVNNSPDGRVHVFVSGDPIAVRSFLIALRQGPPHAHVERVESAEVQMVWPTRGFRIGY